MPASTTGTDGPAKPRSGPARTGTRSRSGTAGNSGPSGPTPPNNPQPEEPDPDPSKLGVDDDHQQPDPEPEPEPQNLPPIAERQDITQGPPGWNAGGDGEPRAPQWSHMAGAGPGVSGHFQSQPPNVPPYHSTHVQPFTHNYPYGTSLRGDFHPAQGTQNPIRPYEHISVLSNPPPPLNTSASSHGFGSIIPSRSGNPILDAYQSLVQLMGVFAARGERAPDAIQALVANPAALSILSNTGTVPINPSPPVPPTPASVRSPPPDGNETSVNGGGDRNEYSRRGGSSNSYTRSPTPALPILVPPYDPYQCLSRITDTSNLNSPNPFNLIFRTLRKGNFPNFSSLSKLEKRENWERWDLELRHLLKVYCLIGFITTAGEDPDPEVPEGLYHIPRARIPRRSVEADYLVDSHWVELNGVTCHIILGSLSPVVFQRLQDTNVDRSSAFDIYFWLYDEYGVGDVNYGSDCWTQAKLLVCGQDVGAFLDEYLGLIRQVRRSGYPLHWNDAAEALLAKVPRYLNHLWIMHKVHVTSDKVRKNGVDYAYVIQLVDKVRSAHHAAKSSVRQQVATQNVLGPRPQPPSRSSTLTAAATTGSQPSANRSIPGARPAGARCWNCEEVGHTKAQCTKPGGDRGRAGPPVMGRGLLAGEDGTIDDGGGVLHELDADACQEVQGLATDGPVEDVMDDDIAALTHGASAITFDDDYGVTSFYTQSDFDLSSYVFGSGDLGGDDLPPRALMVSSAPVLPQPVGIRHNAVLDSGCTQHIIRSKSFFHAFHPARIKIGTANASPLIALGVGTVKLNVSWSDGSTGVLVLLNCLFAPACPLNLLSVGQLSDELGLLALFGSGRTVLWERTSGSRPRRYLILPRPRRLTLMACDFVPPVPQDGRRVSLFAGVSREVPSLTFDLPELTASHWHRRLGHPGWAVTHSVLRGSAVVGVDYKGNLDSPKCVACIEGKTPAKPYASPGNREILAGNLLHMDLSGPMDTKTPGREIFFLCLLDDATNFAWTFLLRNKSDAYTAYKMVEARIKNVTGREIRKIRCDNAPEFVEGDLRDVLLAKGTSNQKSAEYAHAQNGKAERQVRRLKDIAQTLLADSKLPMSFWGFAILTAQYLANRIPTTTLPDGMTPHEALYGDKPDLSGLRVFGCRCFALIPAELRRTMGPRRVEGIMVGYESDRKGWRILLVDRRIVFSHDVIFDELTPGKLIGPPKVKGKTGNIGVEGGNVPTRRSERIAERKPVQMAASATISEEERRKSQRVEIEEVEDVDAGMQGLFCLRADAAHILEEAEAGGSVSEGRMEFEGYMANVGCHRMFDDGETVGYHSRSAMGGFRRLDEGDDGDELPGGYHTRAERHTKTSAVEPGAKTNSTPSTTSPPKYSNCPPELAKYVDDYWTPERLMKPPESFREAMSRPDAEKWWEAMLREIESLEKRKAFDRMKRPTGVSLIGLKWVYDYKYNPDGTIIWGFEKARLVAQGFSQRPDSYDETYAPVARLSTIRAVLALTAKLGHFLFAFDIKTAFLHSTLKSTVYCRQIPGFPESDPDVILQLRVALYGLKQAAFAWYCLFYKVLSRVGMTRCEVDHAFFIGIWDSSPDDSIPMPPDGSPLRLFIPIHVDDGLASTNSEELYLWLIDRLGAQGIQVKNLGVAKMFLSWRIYRDLPTRRLWVSQAPFVQTLIDEWKVEPSPGIHVPMETLPIDMPDGKKGVLVDPNLSTEDTTRIYQSIVGSIGFAAMSTRPELAHTHSTLGQHNSNPLPKHLVAAKHALRYLAATKNFVLMFDPAKEVDPSVDEFIRSSVGFTDADWASDASTRLSVSGYVFFYQGGAVSWSSKRQRVIALSSTEAEYYAIVHGLKEALSFRLFLLICGFPVPSPFPMLVDNKSAIFQATTPALTPRSKHIHIRELFAKQYFSDGTFRAHWVSTGLNVADVFTKTLHRTLFERCRLHLGVIPAPSLSFST